jgi:hypothetical protein
MYIEIFMFCILKICKMRRMNDGDVLFFANDSRDPSQAWYSFLTVHKSVVCSPMSGAAGLDQLLYQLD